MMKSLLLFSGAQKHLKTKQNKNVGAKRRRMNTFVKDDSQNI